MQGISGPSPRRLVVAICALVASAALQPALAQATFPGSTGEYAAGGISDVFDPASTWRSIGPSNLATDARWSPDGTKLVFLASEDGRLGRQSIWIENADGSALIKVVPHTDPSEYFSGPAWSPDGKQIVFARGFTPCDECYMRSELRITDAAAGAGLGQVIAQRDNGVDRFAGPDWSPDPERPQIAVELSKWVGGGFGTRSHLLFVTPGGAEREVAGPGPVYHSETRMSRSLSWAPDGKTVAWAPRHANEIRLFDADGTERAGPKPAASEKIYGVTFTPDGGRLLVGSCTYPYGSRDIAGGNCTPVLLRVPDASRSFDPNEPAEQPLGPGNASYPGDMFAPDFQPADHPIIFIHGYAGSELACGGKVKWFSEGINGLPDLDELILAEDGSSPAQGSCAAEPTRALRTAAGGDIYESTFKALEEMAPGRVHDFAWDWRRDPRDQLDRLRHMITLALGDELSQKQALKEVVLVGHSFGGLFIRAALAEEDLAKQVRRVLTVGTPYWGAPKAIFPLCCGIESPMFSELDAIVTNNELRAFARNNTGNYWLYPSEPLGPWLSWNGAKKIGGPAVRDIVKRLGGSLTAFGRAADGHQKLDGFKKLEPYGLREVRAVVGTGLPTISSAAFSGGSVILDFESGDGTVTARSGTQGPVGTADPLGDDVPIAYVCGIRHVPLPGHANVVEPFKDYIRYGTPPLKTAGCPMRGVGYAIRSAKVLAGGATASSSRKTLLALRQAERAGTIDLMNLGSEMHVVADARTPFSLQLPLDGMALRAYEIDEQGTGKVTRYGAMTGKATLTAGPTKAPVVKLGGKKPPKGALKLRAKPQRPTLRGVVVLARCGSPCTVRARLVRGGKRLSSAKAKLKRSSKKLTLKLRRRVRGKAILVVEATDKKGRFATTSRKLTLR